MLVRTKYQLLRCSLALCVSFAAAPAVGQAPQVHDPALGLSLVAEHPDIVTPIGMAIDSRDRLFVIESHTHHPSEGYAGPTSDRIKIFADQNGNGTLEEIGIFAEGLDAAMNLAFSPAGVLYVACARDVFALPDRDQDGVCDEQQRVLKLETKQGYAHNCLMAMAFDRDGLLYVGRGNVGSMAHTLRGSDGSQVSGYGDGGSICRCRSDGSHVEEFATGFWNPFQITFDRAGRLLCVDNDPDGRGPNRLVHVVEGGDYGYRSLYGGSGNHPFQGWDAELPGLLPLASGTGEAPSGILDSRRSNLPAKYADSVLVTVWNENTIELHALRHRGISISAERSVLVSGGQDFRPVAIDADSKGNIYFTDWVLVDYPNHGRGRIWRIDVPASVDGRGRRGRFDRYEDDPYRAAAASEWDRERIRVALASGDPFLAHLATRRLAEARRSDQLARLARDGDPRLRLGALLALQARGGTPGREFAERFLRDRDVDVRRAALIWVGRSMQPDWRTELDTAIRGTQVTGPLFETYLSAVESLDPRFVEQYRSQANRHSNRLPRRLDDSLLRSIAADRSYSPDVRALAIARIEELDAAANRDLLLAVIQGDDEPPRLAAIRRLRGDPTAKIADLLIGMATDAGQSELLRAEAVAALAYSQTEPSRILPLLDSPGDTLAIEVARTLRHLPLDQQQIADLRDRLAELVGQPSRHGLAEQIAFCLHDDKTLERPQAVDDWQRWLATGGTPEIGRRVFYSPHATCSKCHTLGSRGGTLGPDLTKIAYSVDRRQIIQSILRPSDQFPPQYQAWNIITTDGKVHTGLQIDHKARGAIELFTTAGRVVHFDGEEIEEYSASPNSVMPSGLEVNLGPHEFRDLIAFLSQRR